MIEDDSIKLMRECDAGIKMGINAIDDVCGNVKSDQFREMLKVYKEKYLKLQYKLEVLLNECHDDGKEPGIMAKGMSWIKTNVKMAMEESDKTIADLMTQGSDMGVKSLSRYLNQYEAADGKPKEIANSLIKLGEKFSTELRAYL